MPDFPSDEYSLPLNVIRRCKSEGHNRPHYATKVMFCMFKDEELAHRNCRGVGKTKCGMDKLPLNPAKLAYVMKMSFITYPLGVLNPKLYPTLTNMFDIS